MSSSSTSTEDFINDIDAFLKSPRVAPVACSDWINLPSHTRRIIRQVMGNDDNLLKIFIYNKSRSIDRICPFCRKHYSAANTLDTIEADQSGLYTNGQLEQALSGICSFECFQSLNGSDVLNNWFGKIADTVIISN